MDPSKDGKREDNAHEKNLKQSEKKGGSPESPDSKPTVADEKVLGIKRKVLYPILVGLLVFVGLFYILAKQRNNEQNAVLHNDITRFEEQETIPADTQLRIGSKAPKLNLDVISGKGTAAFEGKPALIEFVASWCPHCQKMAPIVADAINETGVKYIMVGAAKETDQEVKTFHKKGANGPMPGVAVNDTGLKLTTRYGVASYPTFFFVSKDGNIDAIMSGERTKKQLVTKLNELKEG